MSDSDDDWFNQDEEAIVQSFQSHVQNNKNADNTEYIKCHTNAAENVLKQLNIHASATADATDKSTKTSLKFSASELRKILEMEPLDMFLYIMTETNRDIFVDQLSHKDSQKRVLQYTCILETVCKLELPGFELDLWRSFTLQNVLFEHYKRFVAKLFTPKSVWDSEEHLLLRSMKFLLLRSYHMGLLSNSKGLEVIDLLKTLTKQCTIQKIMTQSICMELIEELKQIPDTPKEHMMELNEKNSKDHVYPSIEELLNPISSSNHELNIFTKTYEYTEDYIDTQRKLLRLDFMLPLREFVDKLRKKENLEEFVSQAKLFEDTQIILNPNFDEAKRYGLIFLDLLGSSRNKRTTIGQLKLTTLERNFTDNLKTGSLLCFTSNYDFENLILATTTHSDDESLKAGYIGIEIIDQYNIGNIYDKPFIMFPTPAFFEPYNRVYNYLRNCHLDNFPMEDYIVHGKRESKPPAYAVSNKNNYKYMGKPFILNESVVANPDQMPMPSLNNGQKIALHAALSSEFCLIQGPPGTGKTHLTVELVRTLIENVDDTCTPIVIVAYTNDSLDKFLLKLSAHTDSILRFGSQSRLSAIGKYNVQYHCDFSASTPRLKRLYWLVSSEYKDQFKELQNLYREFDGTDESYQQIVAAHGKLRASLEKLNNMPIITQYYAVRKKAIVGMTTTYAARINFIFRLLKSKIVIFEEAAEILESHILACLNQHTEHVIMVGDHKQLQPYTSSYEHSRSNELNISLFERLIRQEFKYNTLDTQYRMRREFNALICPLIYKQLECGANVDEYPDIRNMAKNLYFLEHERVESKHNLSYMNVYEVEKLYQLATHLTQVAKYTASDIVILTPYQAQVDQMKRQFTKSASTSGIKITTIDSFQGLEADIVLLSLVRTNAIGFVRQSNRICVSLSRAKMGLYIIGSMATLSRLSKMWRAIEEKLRAQECIGADFPCSLT